jgi:hypothetical protein
VPFAKRISLPFGDQTGFESDATLDATFVSFPAPEVSATEILDAIATRKVKIIDK